MIIGHGRDAMRRPIGLGALLSVGGLSPGVVGELKM
jgi:hypothetical protein